MTFHVVNEATFKLVIPVDYDYKSCRDAKSFLCSLRVASYLN